MTVLRFNVFGKIFSVERQHGGWVSHAIGADGKRGPSGFVIPEFVEEGELAQYLFDLFHESATGDGEVRRIL